MSETTATTLTKEQLKAAEDAIIREYISDLTKPTPPDPIAINAWLDVVYRLYSKTRPARVEIVASPQAALKLATELTNTNQTYTDYCGVGEAGWVSYYDLKVRTGQEKPENVKDILALRDFGRCAWDTVLLDECAIVIRRPTLLKTDDQGNLHSAVGPAIAWEDGEKDYCWHGTWVDERIILNPRSYTRDEYLAITNTETRRALSEAAGWIWVAQMLGAKVVDTWTDPKTELTYVLYEVPGVSTSKLLRKQSPKLKDGSQPLYMEPVHFDLKTAQAARKWQAVPGLTAEECEKDPDLSYGIES